MFDVAHSDVCNTFSISSLKFTTFTLLNLLIAKSHVSLIMHIACGSRANSGIIMHVQTRVVYVWSPTPSLVAGFYCIYYVCYRNNLYVIVC